MSYCNLRSTHHDWVHVRHQAQSSDIMCERKGSGWVDISKQALLSSQGLPGLPGHNSSILELGAAILVHKQLHCSVLNQDPYPCLGRASGLYLSYPEWA